MMKNLDHREIEYLIDMLDDRIKGIRCGDIVVSGDRAEDLSEVTEIREKLIYMHEGSP